MKKRILNLTEELNEMKVLMKKLLNEQSNALGSQKSDYPACVLNKLDPSDAPTIGSNRNWIESTSTTNGWSGFAFDVSANKIGGEYWDPRANNGNGDWVGNYFCKGGTFVVGTLNDITRGSVTVASNRNEWSGVTGGTQLIKIGSNGGIVQDLNYMLLDFFKNIDSSYLQTLPQTDQQWLTDYTSRMNPCLANPSNCPSAFDNDTKKLVLIFQKITGIRRDGIVGKQTSQVLLSSGLTSPP